MRKIELIRTHITVLKLLSGDLVIPDAGFQTIGESGQLAVDGGINGVRPPDLPNEQYRERTATELQDSLASVRAQIQALKAKV